MKFIKLDRRYKAYKEHRHTCGFVFDEYGRDSIAIEDVLRGTYGSQYHSQYQIVNKAPKWQGAFLKVSRNNKRFRYLITMENEMMASFVMLKL